MSDLIYWAAKPGPEAVKECDARVSAYYEQLRHYGHYRKIAKTYEMYHGLGAYDPSYIAQAGEKGELLRVKIPHTRSIGNHILVLTTQNRPALRSVSINNDFVSQTAARLGDALLDYYFKTKDLEHVLKDAVEISLATSKAYVELRWDTQKGSEYGATEDGQVIYDGDVTARAHSCLDVVEDIFAKDPIWRITKERVNKYDLAAQFPELAEKVINLTSNSEDHDDFRYVTKLDSDLIWKYTFRHAKTPAMPNGRQIEYVGDDVLLTDGPLPYSSLMLFEICPGKIKGTQLGYTPLFDVLGLNEAMNSNASALATNTDTFGVSNIWTRTGSNITASQLSDGLNHIESDEKPEVIDLVQVNEGIWNGLEFWQTQMEMLTGINDVIRGSPDANLRSGNSMALVAAQALSYNSGLQQSYAHLLTSVGSGVITLLRDFASTPRIAVIVGKANQSLLQEFTGEKLQGIDRVVVEEVSALSRSAAGKLEIANNLLQQGLVTDPLDYLQVLETGRLDPMVSPLAAERASIDRENELIRSGELLIQAVLIENHARHILGHSQVLSDPYMKADPGVVQRVLDHIQEHLNLTMDPLYQQLGPILGHQPVPPPPQMAPPPAGAPTEDVMAPAEPEMPGMPSLPSAAPQEFEQPYEQVQGIPAQ